jgi:hypothetical protein
MRIRYFIPLALAILILFAVAAQKTGIVPPAPIVALTLAGEILLLFQLEDHRVGKFFAELGHAFREAAHHHK